MSLAWAQSGLMLVCGLANLPLLLGHFSAEMVGVWLLIQSLSGYLGLLDFGLSETLGRFVALALGGGDSARAKAIAGAGLHLYLGLAVLAALVVGVVAFFLPALLALPAGTAGIATNCWLWLTAGFCVRLVSTPFSAVLAGSGHLYVIKVFGAGSSILQLCSVFLVTLFDGTILWLAIGQFLVALLMATLVVVSAAVRVRHILPSLRAQTAGLYQPLLEKASHWFLLSLSTSLIWGTDLLLISHFVGASVIPAYSGAMKLIMIGLDFVIQPGSSLSPSISSAVGAGDSEKLQRLYSTGQFLNINLGLFMACGMMLFGPFAISLWLGASNFVGTPTWICMVFVVALNGWNHFNAVALFAGNHTLGAASTCFVQGLLNLALSLLLVGPLGMTGVILGTVLAEILVPQWRFPQLVCRAFGFRVTDWFRRLILSVLPQVLPVLVTIISCALVLPIWGRGVALAFAAAGGAFIAWKYALDPTMRQLILSRLPLRLRAVFPAS